MVLEARTPGTSRRSRKRKINASSSPNGVDRTSSLPAEDKISRLPDMEDRINKLPDELIHYIMSFIDTKYAVQTSVLSKRWIRIWKSLPFLNFDRSSFSEGKKRSFILFVDKVFRLREEFDIQRFSVRWVDSVFDNLATTHVNRWSVNAVKYNVQEISILITQYHMWAYEIPHDLLNCISLKKLEIQFFGNVRHVDIILPSSMNLPQLKVLILHRLSISNIELSKRLFSSCAVLETLNIEDCDIQTDNQRNLIVDSLSLKKFKYSKCRRQLLEEHDTMANIIKLCTPNLEDITFRSLLALDYSLENCSPLSKVSFFMQFSEKEDENAGIYERMSSKRKNVYAKRLMKNLGAVYRVQALRLSCGSLEVLSQFADLLDCQPLLLCNLQSLTLEMWPTRGCLRAIAYLLSISPNITKISLESVQPTWVRKRNVRDDWETGLSLSGMLSKLKSVEIKKVEGCDAELKLLTFLLKNAKVLEKVSLSFRSNIGFPYGERQVKEFKDKLRAVPNASSSVQMAFKN